MRTSTRPDPSVVPPRMAGVFAGVLLAFGGLATVVSSVASDLTPEAHRIDLLVSMCALLLGASAMVMPWNRWDPRSTLVLLPAVLVLIGFGNYANPDPYTADIFFVVVAMWTGLCQGRWVTLRFAPLIAVAYWWPLSLREPLPTLPIATVVVTAVSVMVGEALALLSSRLADAQVRLIDSKERRFATLVQRSSDVTLIFDDHGVITYVSSAIYDTFGYRPEALHGFTLADFAESQVRGIDELTVRLLMDPPSSPGAGEDTFGEVVELEVRHADGHWVHVEAVAQDRYQDPDICGVVVHIRDVHERRQLELELHRQAYHDELTGLPNRTRFREEVAESLSAGAAPAVVFLDLDGFKNVNDTAGHAAGDELLRHVAGRLVSAVGDAAVVARLGGDEFALLVHDAAQAEAVVGGALRSVNTPLQIGPSQVQISASAGVATWSRATAGPDRLGAHGGRAPVGETVRRDAAALIRDADTAMYVAKSSRPAAAVHYRPEMREQLLARLNTESELRAGLERDEFVVHYQPKVHVRTGVIHGAEALVRWRHPELGLVGPSQFIDVAESSGMIVRLGASVLEMACSDAASWQDVPGGERRTVSVNMSPRQFQEPGLVPLVRSVLDRSGLDPTLLTLEVTESLLMRDIEAVSATLQRLRDLGVSLALDDFGTGYSSLSYLQRLPFDMLKIDRSFLEHATTRPGDLSLVQTINRLGHDLGLRTLAEGIETPAQAQLVANIGCDLAQGYLYSPPVSLGQLNERWTSRWPTPRAALQVSTR